MNTLTTHTESDGRPELSVEDMFEPGHGAHLPAAAAGEEVLNGGTVESGVPGDRRDAAALERLGEIPGDVLCVHGFDGGIAAKSSVRPDAVEEMVQGTASRHEADGTSLGARSRGLCDTPVETCLSAAGISRHMRTEMEQTVIVETVMAHEVPGRVRSTSTLDKIRRGRSATLICRAVNSEVGPGAGLIPMYRELLAGYRPAPRERAVQATAVTVASQYLRRRPEGELWALIGGELTDPAKVGFEDRIDSLAWRVDTHWTVDVISVALRPGQIGVDLTGGRVTRSARALEQILDPSGTAEIRVWTLQSPDLLRAASVRSVPVIAGIELPAAVLHEVA
jgi:hypothetical protein